MPSPRPGFVRLRVQAGHDWDALVAYAVAEGLAGIEAMSGIPGTVGAAPVQNIGAYGQEIVQTLVEVELIDESTGEVSTVPAAELGLGFRTSVLKHHYGSAPARRAVILSVTLELAEVGHGERPDRRRAAAHRARLGPDDAVSLAWVRDHVLDDPSPQGHGARPRRPRHVQRGLVLPERDRVGILRPHASRRSARAGRSRPTSTRCSSSRSRPSTAMCRRRRAASPTSRSAPPGSSSTPACARGSSCRARAPALSTKHALALTNRGNAHGRRARRARALHPGPRAVRVRPDPAARARAGERRAVAPRQSAFEARRLPPTRRHRRRARRRLRRGEDRLTDCRSSPS